MSGEIRSLAGWRTFSHLFSGAVIDPAHPEYDVQRAIWNGDFDKRPVAIVRCATQDDVVAAVHLARENDLLVAVRAGGHSYPGHSTCDGGLLIDLAPMRQVKVDAAARTVLVQGGALLRDVDRATAEFGLALPAGVVSHTGMAGLALGGGFGYLSRKFGLTCDNFIRLTVVNADGRTLHASRTENPDLFWGLRGGGGNFGIVTAFECRLHPVPTVQCGWLYFPMEQAVEVLTGHRQIAAEGPRELTVQYMLGAPAQHALVPLDARPRQQVLGARLCYAGDEESGRIAMNDLRTSIRPLVDTVQPRRFADVQQEFDAFSQRGIGWYMKSAQTRELGVPAVEAAVAASLRHCTERALLAIITMGGAIGDVGEMDSGYSGRDSNWHISLEVAFTSPAEREERVAWSKSTHAALRPLLDRQTSYVNMLDDTDIGRLETLYGPEKYRRLREIKSRYDPDNFFRCNSNISPAGAG
jgi:FAD/FMN-containing dehydrogenase